MNTRREELLKILTAVKPGLAAREIVEQTTHFMFTGQSIMTYNDQLSINYPFETDFKCSVKASDLYECLDKMSSDLVNLTYEKGWFQVVTPRSKIKLQTELAKDQRVIDLGEFLLKQADEGEWLPVPENFISSLSLSLFSTSKDATSGAMTCVKVDGKNLMTTDTNRCSWAVLDSEMEPFLIIARDADALLDFNPKEYQLHDRWIQFKTKEGAVFSSRRPIFNLDDYHDITTLFDRVDKQEIDTRFKIPEELGDALDLVSILAREEKERFNIFVKLSLERGLLTCSSPDKRGLATKKLEINYSGDPVEFWINPNFLREVLDKTTRLIVAGGMVHFSRDNFRHLIALPVE